MACDAPLPAKVATLVPLYTENNAMLANKTREFNTDTHTYNMHAADVTWI